MSELFDDAEDKALENGEDEFVEADELIADSGPASSDARRRLENLLEEKRLRDELEDFLDY